MGSVHSPSLNRLLPVFSVRGVHKTTTPLITEKPFREITDAGPANLPRYSHDRRQTGYLSSATALKRSRTRRLKTPRLALLNKARKARTRAWPQSPHWRAIRMTSLVRSLARSTRSASSNTGRQRHRCLPFLLLGGDFKLVKAWRLTLNADTWKSADSPESPHRVRALLGKHAGRSGFWREHAA